MRCMWNVVLAPQVLFIMARRLWSSTVKQQAELFYTNDSSLKEHGHYQAGTRQLSSSQLQQELLLVQTSVK